MLQKKIKYSPVAIDDMDEIFHIYISGKPFSCRKATD